MKTLGTLLCTLSLQGTSVHCLFLSTLAVNVSLNRTVYTLALLGELRGFCSFLVTGVPMVVVTSLPGRDLLSTSRGALLQCGGSISW